MTGLRAFFEALEILRSVNINQPTEAKRSSNCIYSS